jgi:hypothetical protein
MKYLLFFCFLFAFTNAFAIDCPDFETTLESIMNRIKIRAEVKANSNLLSSDAVSAYKLEYSKKLKLEENSNRNFMSEMAKAKKSGTRSVYFDVENSVQKKLNDQIFGEKTMVDAVNTSFLKKFYTNIQNNPELSKRISGSYKDYKSLRFRVDLKEGENGVRFEKMFNEAYKKAVSDFTHEFNELNLNSLIKTRTDDIAHPERWFLAGSGDEAIEANMAARGARTLSEEKKIAGDHLKYRDHIDQMDNDMREVERIRQTFNKNTDLLKLDVLEKLENGNLIPTKKMINILRKYKVGDFQNDELYLKAIQKKTKQIFGKELDSDTIKTLSEYQRKVDAFSPPLFIRESVEIKLEQAEAGIVSVDFTGIGVDNIYQQMKALASVNYQEVNKAKMLKEAFGKLDSHVDEVTEEMIKAKRYFSELIQNINGRKAKPLFSGDDGIYMPLGDAWTDVEKKALISGLSNASDPSKYRVTFVNTRYTNGRIIPKNERSLKIVRAETLEKSIRENIVGMTGMRPEEAKNLIIGIDFSPNMIGGDFKLMIGGRKLMPEELKLIHTSVKKLINTKEGETFSGIMEMN